MYAINTFVKNILSIMQLMQHLFFPDILWQERERVKDRGMNARTAYYTHIIN